ncbi:Casein kinase II subunit alpha [Escovopsis weberi]|uniref:non-specific serine/threonine protein kinase n=1 Tax=Escovopsis weberi TaxID=150374 RepID=A0A0M9VS09_ESCWE|nr:Casein kinase II subunit alpha [Escovopsis weberi]
MDDYEVVRRLGTATLGRGKFADVFEGVDRHLAPCIIKCPNQMGRRRVHKEVEVLHALRGGPHILSLLDVVVDPHTDSKNLVFEYCGNEDFRTLYPWLCADGVRLYMRMLLEALEFCHARGVMHRDIRPPNVLIDHPRRKLRLSGFDFADFHTLNRAYTARVGRGCIRAPELLLLHDQHDCSIDLWNFGCMLAAMVFRREPFFHGSTAAEQIRRIARVLGVRGLLNYIERYDLDSPEDMDGLAELEERRWEELVNEENRGYVGDGALDVLEKLVRWDPKERWTAAQALEHPYFALDAWHATCPTRNERALTS